MTADMRPGEERALLQSGSINDLYEVAREYGYTGNLEEFSRQMQEKRDIERARESIARERKNNSKLVERLLKFYS